MNIRILTFIISQVFLNTTLFSQELNKADSLEICRITQEFYNWYANSIKSKNYSALKPEFIESKNGMTTLEFNEYFDNLREHHFSEELIENEKKTYCDCLENLEKIKYQEFKEKFVDLDAFENVKCDFGNYHRWIGGQEPIDGIRIKNLEETPNSNVNVTIVYFTDNGVKYGISYWGKNIVTLKKMNKTWKIVDINSRN